MSPTIKTRLLIISDTHGHSLPLTNRPTQPVHIAIHSGDLTNESKLSEYRTAITLLSEINAPLKLAIAGNHDFTMDIPAFERKVAEVSPPLEPELVAREYGLHGEARQLFENARGAGIVFLDEGTHTFTLGNGALLTVYASPYTPARGEWGFQYPPEKGHEFAMKEGFDVAITHGPPQGIMDYTDKMERAGCPGLFAAVATARPRVHCFGHIHEGWGAKLVTWKNVSTMYDERPSHMTAIDNGSSAVIGRLTDLCPPDFGTKGDEPEKKRLEKQLKRWNRDKCCITSHCNGDEHVLEQGKQTLFVNASITSAEDLPEQKPWLVEIELPRATL